MDNSRMFIKIRRTGDPSEEIVTHIPSKIGDRPILPIGFSIIII